MQGIIIYCRYEVLTHIINFSLLFPLSLFFDSITISQFLFPHKSPLSNAASKETGSIKRKPSGGPPPPHAAAAAIQEQRRRSSGAPSSQPASSVPGAIAPSPITSPEGVRHLYYLSS